MAILASPKKEYFISPTAFRVNFIGTEFRIYGDNFWMLCVAFGIFLVDLINLLEGRFIAMDQYCFTGN